MSEQQTGQSFELDGTRPIARGSIEIANTFEIDGIRPIGESPAYLVAKPQDSPQVTDSVTDLAQANVAHQNTLTLVNHKRPVDRSEITVVNSFEEDGIRPIMANQHQVVGTLNLDGVRPITSSNYQPGSILEIDGQRPVDRSQITVVDMFEDDGLRPIIARKP